MTLFGDDPEEMHSGDNGGMSQYQALMEQERQDKLLKQQIRKHGEELESARTLTGESGPRPPRTS